MLLLYCVLTVVMAWHCYITHQQMDKSTKVSFALLMVCQLTSIWNESRLISGNFRKCMFYFELRYGLQEILLMFVGAIIITGYHNACS